MSCNCIFFLLWCAFLHFPGSNDDSQKWYARSFTLQLGKGWLKCTWHFKGTLLYWHSAPSTQWHFINAVFFITINICFNFSYMPKRPKRCCLSRRSSLDFFHACCLCALSSTNNENSNAITDDTIASSMKKVPHFEMGGISTAKLCCKKGAKIRSFNTRRAFVFDISVFECGVCAMRFIVTVSH